MPDPLLLPGAALVLALGAASAGVPGAAERAAALVPAMGEGDWGLADRWARSQRAEGVLCRALAADTPSARTIAERWSRIGMVADFRQARIESALGEALAVLADARISTMLLKGAGLAAAVYPRGFADRPMEDVDVLVEPAAAMDGYELLQRAGWESKATGEAATTPPVSHHHLPQLRHRESGAILELHHAILPSGNPFDWDDERVRASAKVRPVRGVETRVASAEELLLHGALHLAWAHELRIGGWGWMRDLAVLAPLVDWTRVWSLAAERRAESCLYWALRLGMRLAGGEMPIEMNPSVMEAHGGRRGLLAGALERHLVLGAVPGHGVPSEVRLRRAAWSVAIRPVRSGHGPSRPWQASSALDGSDAGAVSYGRQRGVGALLGSGVRELRRFPDWLSWGVRVLR